MLGHKVSLGKFKNIEVISSIFSDHNTMILEINYKGKNVKNQKHMEAKQNVTKQPIDHWRSERTKKIPRDKWKWKYNDPKPMWHSKSSSKRQVHSNTNLPQETRKLTNKLTLHLKQVEKEKQRKPGVSRRKEIIRSE